MKKLLTALLSIILVVSMGMFFVGCGQTEEEHQCVETWVIDVDPTCTEDGLKHSVCEGCGKVSEPQSIKAIGHDYGDYVSNGDGTHTKTCANDRRHKITDDCFGGQATCTELAICKGCSTSYGELEDHVGGEATCTEQAVCTICSNPYGELEDHQGGEATCTEQAVCTVCSTPYGELEPHEHQTLMHNGEQHWMQCVCGDKAQEENHIPGDPATKESSQTCSKCDYIIVPNIGHIHTENLIRIDAVAQSCLEQGNIEYYICSCGKWFKDSTATIEIYDEESVVIQKDDHSYNVQNASEEYKYSSATCTEKAVYFYSCKCGKMGEETFEYGQPLDHDYGDWVSNGDGTHTKTCANDKSHQITDECFGGQATCTELAICEGCSTAYGELEDHQGGEATCTEQAVCGICSNPYGELEDHQGGQATCTEQAVCTICFNHYGELEPHEHKTLMHDENSHWMQCVCGDKAQEAQHSGGTATCLEKAQCSVCEVIYGEYGDHDYENGICLLCEFVIGTDGLQYQLINEDTEYAISAYNGESTIVYIPETYNGKPVTTIGEYAFYYSTEITAVIIPSSIKSIERASFYYCTSLVDLTLGDGVEKIGEYAFSSCVSLTSVEIPNGIKYFGDSAFDSCTALTKINFMGTIDEWTQIVFANSILSSGYDLYVNGQLVTEAVLTTATKINDYVFSNCRSLISIEIPNCVKYIGEGVFDDCQALTKVNFIGKIDEWAEIGFAGSILSSTRDLYINGQLVTEVVLSSATKISDYAFSKCKTITTVIILDSVTSIGKCAFYDCQALTSVIIPEQVAFVGNYAFYNCSSLTICCEVIEKPTTWGDFWNSSNCEVQWGYIG